MMDAAVLLNLTGRLSFEAADPMMSLISAGKPLLFYDRLSVVPFPSDETKCQHHVERLASDMRNLLEARSLSTEDGNERIRIIVTLDLARGAFQPEGSSLMFPAQKVRQFKRTIEDVFGKGNPLLDRFEYIFVFLDDQSETGIFYRTLAHDGITGGGTVKWLSQEDLNLNQARDSILKELGDTHAELQLTSPQCVSAYNRFIKDQNRVIKTVADRLAMAGIGDEFEQVVRQRLDHISTVGDFSKFDYDEAISSSVTLLTGLSSEEFKKDCTFFITRNDNSTLVMRLKCETFIASLVQFLATIDGTDYDNLLKANKINKSARIFMMDMPENDSMNTNAFSQLKQLVDKCCPHLETARWRRDQKVSYKHFSSRADDPMTVDSYMQINDRFAEQRQQMFDKFKEARKVPFFFGKPVGDWSWYKQVLSSAADIYHFEMVNDRPLYDIPKRLTDNEMDEEERENTYTELESAFNTYSKTEPEIKKCQDLNQYLSVRSKIMKSFGNAYEELKTQMVKLGYFTCLLWIGILSLVGFTLNYAYHFFMPANEDHPLLIAACFCIASLLFVVAALLGRAKIKSKIEAVYYEMDSCFNQLQINLKSYLDDVCTRLKNQNEADIRRKNIDEIKSKLDAFSRHNRQVDLWVKYFQDIATKLSTLDIPDAKQQAKAPFDQNDFDLENGVPSLPECLIRQFQGMKAEFTVKGTPVNNVTSFYKKYKFAEEEQN